MTADDGSSQTRLVWQTHDHILASANLKLTISSTCRNGHFKLQLYSQSPDSGEDTVAANGVGSTRVFIRTSDDQMSTFSIQEPDFHIKYVAAHCRYSGAQQSQLLQVFGQIINDRLIPPSHVLATLRLFPGRIIRVPLFRFGCGPVESTPIIRIQTLAFLQPLRKIGIGEEQPPKRQRIRVSSFDYLPAVMRTPTSGRH